MLVDNTGNTVMHDNAQLMTQMAEGQDDAFEILIDRWRTRVWTFIDRMCGYLGRTDDIFQDVWMRIYLYRANYDPYRTFKSYLFTVVVNCCRTNIAKAGKRLPEPIACPEIPRETTVDSLSNEPEPLDALINHEQHYHIRQAINQLPEKQRTVALLYLLFDSNYSLIADTLSLRVGTVRSHMSLALKNLRKHLLRIPVTSPVLKGQVSHE